ncbi:hypothetical protein G6L89_010310 [Agrobacterium fabrum]|uniref:hypothetical protein n=1 Tax=Agrobacterium fabrum TaxID=1176649 RepID=UPI0015748B50|nr:hypothetical protein [Agrobacterium fabrum]NTB08221.1 hypothetical protein [Agrobacterium fabrum]
MSNVIRKASEESVIDRRREEIIAKVVSGTVNSQERAKLEELSSARAAMLKRSQNVILSRRTGFFK